MLDENETSTEKLTTITETPATQPSTRQLGNEQNIQYVSETFKLLDMSSLYQLIMIFFIVFGKIKILMRVTRRKDRAYFHLNTVERPIINVHTIEANIKTDDLGVL